MNRTPYLLWIIFILIVLLPSTAGRFLLDIAGGLLILSLAVPILLGVIGFIGWKVLQSKLIQCEVCGATTFNSTSQCPICGSELKSNNKVQKSSKEENIPASSATIDINAQEIQAKEIEPEKN